jgi:hypothetical protein
VEDVQDLLLDDCSAAEGRGIAAKGTEKTVDVPALDHPIRMTCLTGSELASTTRFPICTSANTIASLTCAAYLLSTSASFCLASLADGSAQSATANKKNMEAAKTVIFENNIFIFCLSKVDLALLPLL